MKDTVISRAGHATALPRQRDNKWSIIVFCLQYIRCGYSIPFDTEALRILLYFFLSLMLYYVAALLRCCEALKLWRAS